MFRPPGGSISDKRFRTLCALACGVIIVVVSAVAMFINVGPPAIAAAQQAKLGLQRQYPGINIIKTTDEGAGYGRVTFIASGVRCRMQYTTVGDKVYIDATDVAGICGDPSRY